MNQSFTSQQSNSMSVSSACSALSTSLKSMHHQAPPELIAFVYDIPRGVSSADIQAFLDSHGFESQVQLKPFPATNSSTKSVRPFTQALVKFQSTAQMRVATEKLRFFSLPDSIHQMRLMPFDPTLYKGKLPKANSTTHANSTPNKSEQSLTERVSALRYTQGLNLLNSSIESSTIEIHSNSVLEDDFESTNGFDQNELACLPDNSSAQVNICVTGLDSSLTSADLYTIFERFGKIKSCKVATDPQSGLSKNYGYVWFQSEKSCTQALNAKNLPYTVQLYQAFCFRQVEKMTINDSTSLDQPEESQAIKKQRSVIISGFPKFFTEYQLAQLIGPETIDEISIKNQVATIQFKQKYFAEQALQIIDGIDCCDCKLSVKPMKLKSQQQSQLTPAEKNRLLSKASFEFPNNNLYVTQIPKTHSQIEVRRKFALLGKISSFKLIDSDSYSTNIAYVAYVNSEHASNAFKMQPLGKVQFHLPKVKPKKQNDKIASGVLFDISNQLSTLSKLDLLACAKNTSKFDASDDCEDKENFRTQLAKAHPTSMDKIDQSELNALSSLFERLKTDVQKDQQSDQVDHGQHPNDQSVSESKVNVVQKLTMEQLTNIKQAMIAREPQVDQTNRQQQSIKDQVSMIPHELLAFNPPSDL